MEGAQSLKKSERLRQCIHFNQCQEYWLLHLLSLRDNLLLNICILIESFKLYELDSRVLNYMHFLSKIMTFDRTIILKRPMVKSNYWNDLYLSWNNINNTML